MKEPLLRAAALSLHGLASLDCWCWPPFFLSLLRLSRSRAGKLVSESAENLNQMLHSHLKKMGWCFSNAGGGIMARWEGFAAKIE